MSSVVVVQCPRCDWTRKVSAKIDRFKRSRSDTALVKHIESCGLCENWPGLLPHPTCTCKPCSDGRARVYPACCVPGEPE